MQVLLEVIGEYVGRLTQPFASVPQRGDLIKIGPYYHRVRMVVWESNGSAYNASHVPVVYLDDERSSTAETLIQK